MGDYVICVKDMATYTIIGAKSEKDAINKAIKYFRNDEENIDSEEVEDVTKEDCEIISFEEYEKKKKTFLNKIQKRIKKNKRRIEEEENE